MVGHFQSGPLPKFRQWTFSASKVEEHKPRDILRNMTIEEIRISLREKAEKRFGKTRAEELRPDIEQTAAELLLIYGASLELEDEP